MLIWLVRACRPAPEPLLTQHTLDNGVQIGLLPNAPADHTVWSVVVSAGSDHEDPAARGAAHLLERAARRDCIDTSPVCQCRHSSRSAGAARGPRRASTPARLARAPRADDPGTAWLVSVRGDTLLATGRMLPDRVGATFARRAALWTDNSAYIRAHRVRWATVGDLPPAALESAITQSIAGVRGPGPDAPLRGVAPASGVSGISDGAVRARWSDPLSRSADADLVPFATRLLQLALLDHLRTAQGLIYPRLSTSHTQRSRCAQAGRPPLRSTCG